jgi:hypothetical protein
MVVGFDDMLFVWFMGALLVYMGVNADKFHLPNPALPVGGLQTITGLTIPDNPVLPQEAEQSLADWQSYLNDVIYGPATTDLTSFLHFMPATMTTSMYLVQNYPDLRPNVYLVSEEVVVAVEVQPLLSFYNNAVPELNQSVLGLGPCCQVDNKMMNENYNQDLQHSLAIAMNAVLGYMAVDFLVKSRMELLESNDSEV